MPSSGGAGSTQGPIGDKDLLFALNHKTLSLADPRPTQPVPMPATTLMGHVFIIFMAKFFGLQTTASIRNEVGWGAYKVGAKQLESADSLEHMSEINSQQRHNRLKHQQGVCDADAKDTREIQVQ